MDQQTITGARLKEMRLQIKASQRKIASLLNVSDQTVSDMERGKYKSGHLVEYQKLLFRMGAKIPPSEIARCLSAQTSPEERDFFETQITAHALSERRKEITTDAFEMRYIGSEGAVDTTVINGQVFIRLAQAKDSLPFVHKWDLVVDMLDSTMVSEYAQDERDLFYRVRGADGVGQDLVMEVFEYLKERGVEGDIDFSQETSVQGDITALPFGGTDIQIIHQEGSDQVWVAIQSLCEAIGISDVGTQIKKIKNNPSYLGRYGLKAHESKGKVQQLFCLTPPAMTRWLSSIHPMRVDPSVREMLMKFQWEAEEAIYERFFKKKETVPVAQIAAPLSFMERLEAIDEKLLSLLEEANIAKAREADLPDTFDTALEKDLRTHLNNAVLLYARRARIPPQDAYNKLYKEIKDRYKVDVKARAEKRNTIPMNVLQEDKLIDRAYAVARRMLDALGR